MTRILVVHHSPTPRVASLAAAALAGARTAEEAGVEVDERHALQATADDMLAADALVLGTTANFGYISGALKHFFDTTYDDVRDATAGRPFSYWIHGGYDTTGAERAMESITTGFGLRSVADPVVFTGDVDEEHLTAVHDMAATVAWSLTL